ncbi:hypothetical protein F511_42060 [Dorcoceras hygrometricum]|uniref:Uncharacterized protein n=1 Tax=Dorcoceras hygrometricum TaxID=472368 RepID=A0A2Z7BL99_9LAMI|nr:hypothetical protein F511_42060 [Dorcoceras hygrometricum]
MHTSRNCVTNYIHMSFMSSCLDGNCVGKVLIHSLNNLAQLTKCASESVSGFPVVGREKLATGFPNDWSNLRLFLASVPAGPIAPADLSSSAEHDVVTNDIIIDGPLRCSSWFPFDVPAGPSSSSSACSWFISFQLIHFAPAGSTWPPPDFEHLT